MMMMKMIMLWSCRIGDGWGGGEGGGGGGGGRGVYRKDLFSCVC